jgi:hypothetical protein
MSTVTVSEGRRTKAPLQRLPFEDWKDQVGQALHRICADGYTLQDVPKSFDFQAVYDAGVDIERAAAMAYFTIE